MIETMYFETTMHKRRPVASAAEASDLIQGRLGELHDFDAIVWTANGREIAVVADNHCNNPWLEVAVIDLTNRYQIESITADWCKGSKLRELFEICETTEFRMTANGTVTLPLDGKGDDTKANFECGCCGQYFTSTLADQRKYDQDNGYGICSGCARAYR